MTDERRKRRTFSPEQKVSILRQHLLENVTVSNLCDRHGIKPNQFYDWQKQFFTNGAAAFERRSDGPVKRLQQKCSALETRITQKDEVIAEIMASHVKLKKTLGEI